MDIRSTPLPGVVLIRPKLFRDGRGLFLEAWNEQRFRDAGLDIRFVQDNFSHTAGGTLRGLHYQLHQPQGKLIHVTRGRVFDVAVDLRRSSPGFGNHLMVELDAREHTMLWIPAGCAHGFYVPRDETADLHYKCDAAYAPGDEWVIRWDDPDLGIDWPIEPGHTPLVSEKDRAGLHFRETGLFD